jgi:hypothetical protein
MCIFFKLQTQLACAGLDALSALYGIPVLSRQDILTSVSETVPQRPAVEQTPKGWGAADTSVESDIPASEIAAQRPAVEQTPKGWDAADISVESDIPASETAALLPAVEQTPKGWDVADTSIESDTPASGPLPPTRKAKRRR